MLGDVDIEITDPVIGNGRLTFLPNAVQFLYKTTDHLLSVSLISRFVN